MCIVCNNLCYYQPFKITIILFPVLIPCSTWVRTVKYRKTPVGKFHERMEKYGENEGKGGKGWGGSSEDGESERNPFGRLPAEICLLLFVVLVCSV